MMADEPKRSILLADGSSANRAMLASVFSRDFTVRQASDGMEALDLLRRQPDTDAVLLDAHLPLLDGCGVLNAMRMDDALRDIPVIVSAASYDMDNQLRSLDFGAADVMTQPINPQLALHRVQNLIMRKEADRQSVRAQMLEQLLLQSEIDEKTGIYNKHAFCRKVSELLRADPARAYIIVRWDIDRFRVYNDVFGVPAGDAYLARIGEAYRARRDGAIYGHWVADHFVVCMLRDALETRDLKAEINGLLSYLREDFDFVARVGVYPVDDPTLDVSLMCDRALLALRSVKNHYTTRVAWYDESMRSAFIEEQEIVGQMNAALEQEQFVVYLQPQCDYSRKTLHGAEALVRWIHPEKGLIPPGRFIPVFERNGFISRLDEFVWERVCRYQREWLDRGLQVAPISVNVSRYDLYNPRLCENFLALIERYGLTPSLLRLEITESAYMDDPDQLVRVVSELRAAGFAVEMDDFGSGYSSLNTLKSITVDMLKLDMKFVENSMEDARSGSILTSVIRMAHWIKLPVIAEGVETREQAEYLKSVGCPYIQGYYYARPMPAEQYEAFLREARLDDGSSARYSEDLKGAENFLTASTQAALLFNSFVGGAAIVEYDGENVEALRINDQFFDTLGTTREAYEGRQLKLLDRFDAENRARFLSAIRRAVDTRGESGCELRSLPLAEHVEVIYTRARMRLLAANGSRYILYLAVENITRQTQLLKRNTRLSEQLSTLIDSVPGGILDFELTDHIRVIYANDTTASMFGYTHEEYTRLYSDNPLSVVCPEDMAAIRDQAKQILSGTANDFEAIYRHICPDGGWRWVRLTGHVVRREEARAFCSGILMDIDAQVKNEQTARLQAEEIDRQRVSLQTLYDTAPCGIMRFIAGADGRLELRSVNDTAWRLLGYASREDYLRSVRGRSILKDIYPVDLDAVRECIASALETERGAADCDHRVIRADGGIRWLQSFFQRERNSGAERVIQFVFTDVTERKQESLTYISNALFALYDEVYEFNLEQDVCYMRYSKRLESRWTGKAFTVGEYTDELCGRYAHPEDQAKIRAFYADMSRLTERAPATLEYRYLTPEGGFRWISATALRVRDETYLNCNRDITELRNAQRLARENETLQMLVDERRTEDERSRLFITSADIAVCDYDPARDTMRIQSRSPEGGVAEQTVGNYLATLPDNPEVSVMDRVAVRDAFLDILKAPARRTLEFRGNRFGGFGLCLAQFVSIADGAGKVYRVIGQVSRAPENHSGALAERLRVHTGLRFDGLEYSRAIVDRALRILESASDSRAAVQSELADIGSLYGVSRAYVIEEDGDGARCSSTFAWCAEDNRIGALRRFSYPEGKRERFLRVFDDRGVLACTDIDTLPGWLREELAPQGVRAILMCAIMESGAFHGYVGFDECGGIRHWTGEQADTLRVIAHLLGAFLFKSRAKSTFELSSEIRSEIDHSPALLYVIDPDSCEVLYCNDAVRTLIGQPMTGQPCYRAFLGEREMCAVCPLREYQRTGVALPVRVHRGSGRYIMQASPFLWEGRKAVLISGSDASGEGLKSNRSQARA